MISLRKIVKDEIKMDETSKVCSSLTGSGNPCLVMAKNKVIQSFGSNSEAG